MSSLVPNSVSEYMAENGRRGGLKKGPTKRRSSEACSAAGKIGARRKKEMRIERERAERRAEKASGTW